MDNIINEDIRELGLLASKINEIKSMTPYDQEQYRNKHYPNEIVNDAENYLIAKEINRKKSVIERLKNNIDNIKAKVNNYSNFISDLNTLNDFVGMIKDKVIGSKDFLNSNELLDYKLLATELLEYEPSDRELIELLTSTFITINKIVEITDELNNEGLYLISNDFYGRDIDYYNNYFRNRKDTMNNYANKLVGIINNMANYGGAFETLNGNHLRVDILKFNLSSEIKRAKSFIAKLNGTIQDIENSLLLPFESNLLRTRSQIKSISIVMTDIDTLIINTYFNTLQKRTALLIRVLRNKNKRLLENNIIKG